MEFDIFLRATDECETIEIFGVVLNKLDTFKKLYPEHYEGLREAYEDLQVRPKLTLIQ